PGLWRGASTSGARGEKDGAGQEGHFRRRRYFRPSKHIIIGSWGAMDEPGTGRRGRQEAAASRTMAPISAKIASWRLKWPDSPYRPAAQQGSLADRLGSGVPERLLGRSQAVRQRILIPPFGGSIPPAPASKSLIFRPSSLRIFCTMCCMVLW